MEQQSATGVMMKQTDPLFTRGCDVEEKEIKTLRTCVVDRSNTPLPDQFMSLLSDALWAALYKYYQSLLARARYKNDVVGKEIKLLLNV